MIITVYKTTTGEITRVCSGSTETVLMQPGEEESYVEGHSNDTRQYVVEGVITDKSPMPCTLDTATISANGVDVATLTGVPAGAALMIDRTAQGAADGTAIELTFDYPGDYRVRARLFPYLDYEVTIHAT